MAKVVEVVQADVHARSWRRAFFIAILLSFAIGLTETLTITRTFQHRISPCRRNDLAFLVNFDPVRSDLNLLVASRSIGHRFSSPLHDLQLFGLAPHSLEVFEVACLYRRDV